MKILIRSLKRYGYYSLLAYLMLTFRVQANESDKLTREQLAQHYMQLLLAGDYQHIAQYLNDNSTLEDRTASKTYKGKSNILEFWQLSTQGMTSYHFEQQRFYVAKKLAVFIGVYHYQGEGSLYGFPGQQIEFSIPAVTVLTIDVDEQRVTLHQDFFDYASLAPKIQL
ncbi:nuclear transport factor 2 family protein [Motilimonas sp. 1_MG-2023]|uniref:nuclear transport factor 2 family protein n=1 Tax=Motilimonas sp. 1_MG-2023 TaxID=3062672 RepID=UPI0026E11C10|nr:nuclear transport factor 2 family protein [Motilimonas sp. 1_MG-2023]MDO6525734.1 nuclear transport factor 2 family protein [Motilimonas sp. 1_MG-2023]